MPTYDYVCDACGHSFDEFQSFKDEPLKKCPSCGKNKLRRLFGTGAAILFKGSGFYETDYRSESYKSAAKADQDAAKSASPGKNGANGATGTDSASAPKKDASDSKTST
jgi:putative FmdB family regulatory protein